MFKAVLINKAEDAAQTAAVAELENGQLPAGDVLIQVDYSTINYKDALPPWTRPTQRTRASSFVRSMRRC